MRKSIACCALIVTSYVIAFESFVLPYSRMPVDYYAALRYSLPLSGLWLVVSTATICKTGYRGLPVLLGVKLALWWPVSLVLDGIPLCYSIGNCE